MSGCSVRVQRSLVGSTNSPGANWRERSESWRVAEWPPGRMRRRDAPHNPSLKITQVLTNSPARGLFMSGCSVRVQRSLVGSTNSPGANWCERSESWTPVHPCAMRFWTARNPSLRIKSFDTGHEENLGIRYELPDKRYAVSGATRFPGRCCASVLDVTYRAPRKGQTVFIRLWLPGSVSCVQFTEMRAL